MDKFLIDELVKTKIGERINPLIASGVKLNIEVQDAGQSIFVRLFVTMHTTVEEILQMNDDIETVLLDELPDRAEGPRWAQAYLIGGRIIYSNMGGMKL